MSYSESSTSRKTQSVRKTLRCERANVRQAERDKRSSAEQLLLLDLRLGVGVGAVRERARLIA